MRLAGASVTAAEAPAVVEYSTKLTITTERGFQYHGSVLSDRDGKPGYDSATKVRECMEGREVILFKQRPGADLILATLQSQFMHAYGKGYWGLARGPEARLNRVYATVSPKVGDGFVCSGDRSPNICSGGNKRGLMCARLDLKGRGGSAPQR